MVDSLTNPSSPSCPTQIIDPFALPNVSVRSMLERYSAVPREILIKRIEDAVGELRQSLASGSSVAVERGAWRACSILLDGDPR